MLVGIIVPDVHELILKLKKILSRYRDRVQWVIFLGDFFDTFQNNGRPTIETIVTAEWLAENVHNPKYKFTWGNHDLHYAFPFDPVICSGWNEDKLKIIQKHLNDNDHWKKFKLLHWIKGKAPKGSEDQTGNLIVEPKKWMVSHAGIHPSLLHPMLGFDEQSLEAYADEAMWKLRYCQTITSFIAHGRGRGGPALVGGVDWLDWETEFFPINGLNQIVGHSLDTMVRTKTAPDSMNYCIDTALRCIMEVDEYANVKVVKV